MKMPRANPLLKGAYITLLLMMFSFFTGLILHYQQVFAQQQSPAELSLQDGPTAQDSRHQALTNSGQSSQQEAATTTESPILSPGDQAQYQDGFTLHGIERQLDIDDTFETQLTTMWFDYYQLTQRQQLSQTEAVVSYHITPEQPQQITVTLGYQAQAEQALPAGFVQRRVYSGHYLATDDVLSLWLQPGDYAPYLSYQNDYERVTLDNQFNVIQVQGFVALGR